MGTGARRPAPVARTRRCAFLLENLNLQKATGDDNAVYEDLQVEFWNETAVIRIDNKARQGGWSFAAAADALAAGWLEPGTVCNFTSYNKEETKEKIRYVKECIKALWPGVRPEIVTDNVYELEIDNGSRFIGWPSKPPRGKGRARYYVDEWAHINLDQAIKTAAMGGIGRGGIVRGGSTPLGQRGVFYDILTNPHKYKTWVRKTWPWWHFYGLCKDVKKAKAVAPGTPPEELVERFGTERLKIAYEGMGDREEFLQEYACEFIDEEGTFFPYELIMSCEPKCPEDCEEDCETCSMFAPVSGAPLGMGFDVGRHKHRSAIAALQQKEQRTLVSLDVMHKTPFPDQRRKVASRIDELKPVRTCGDYIGMGGPIIEELQERYGKARVEGVILSNPKKEEIMTGLKARFEKREILIPVDKRIRAHLHAIRQIRMKGGGFRYDSEADETGHADIAWALGLADYGLGSAPRPRAKGTLEGARLDWGDDHRGSRRDW